MKSSPLWLFDFDGVIVDGMPEYWLSSRKACIELLKGDFLLSDLPVVAPDAFVQLRPWVKHGWEMVLLTAELLRKDSYLVTHGALAFSDSYQVQCNESLKTWNWSPIQLQLALEDARRIAIDHDKKYWFSMHTPYPWVLKGLDVFSRNHINWAVLTTKGRDFASELLDYFQLNPTLIYGHEDGDKIDVLRKIVSNWDIQGFVEDRRATLEEVLVSPELSSVPCYLASWGYLKPNHDEYELPKGISLISPETMSSPLASRP